MERTNFQCKLSSFCNDLSVFCPGLAEDVMVGNPTDDVQEEEGLQMKRYKKFRIQATKCDVIIERRLSKSFL